MSAADDVDFLRGLIDGMRCGVLSVDHHECVVLMNEPAQQILELSDAPPRGTPLADALGDHPQLVRVLHDAFTMTSLPNRAEIELERGAGPCKTIGFTVSLIRATTGHPRGAAVFFKDLTPIEHREEQERLKERLAALGQMAACMAHEIRNPLAAIEVSCELLRRRLESFAKEQELLDRITGEVRRLNRTVSSSLEFVRPIRPNLAPAALGPLLEEAIAVARERCGRPAVRIERRLLPALPVFLMDRALLRQVFVNLIVNALEAVADHGTVTVSAEVLSVPGDQSLEQFVVVRVADDGPGIDDEVRGRVFYPFFTTKKQGSGVGLATAKKIVDGHRGLIDVSSHPGQGATFTVRLPMLEEDRGGLKT